MPRRATLGTIALLLVLAATAHANQSVRLTAAFTPDRLDTPTTITFGFHVYAHGHVPSPLTAIDLHYPRNLGIGASNLGEATCPPRHLEAYGPAGCPANSQMGHGIALAEIEIGHETLPDEANVTLLAGPPQEEHLDILVYADSLTPIYGQIIFSAQLIPERPPFGGRLHFNIPLVPSFPLAPDVSIVQLETTLGPMGITYYEHTHGKLTPYQPAGILTPPSCPKGGFPFTASLTFQDGTNAHARTTVPCPRGH